MAKPGDVVAKCTVEQFDKALIHVLGYDVCKVLGNRTTRQVQAIITIFEQGLEHLPAYKKTCSIIRDGATSLSKNGYYSFKQ